MKILNCKAEIEKAAEPRLGEKRKRSGGRASVLVLVLYFSLFAFAISALSQTTVLFPLTSMFGGPYAGTMTITSQNPLLNDSNSFYLGTFINVPVAGGTNPVVRLQPNQYLVSWTGVKTTMRLTVPASTNTVNALSLTTNVPVFLYTPPPGNLVTFTLATNLVGSTNGWYYNVSYGSLAGESGTIYLLTSPDQTNWTLASPAPLYRDPDLPTVNTAPFARESFPLEHNGRIYMAYAREQGTPGDPSIGIAVSTDLTNYNRIAVLHPLPMGRTNDYLWAVTMYEETNGADYLIFPYSTNGTAPGSFKCYAMPRLDETWTNWGAPQVILATNFLWDGFVIRQSPTNLLLYQATAQVYQATNIYGPWSLSALAPPETAESMRIFALSTNNWLWVDQVGDRFQSTNAGISWKTLPGYFGRTPTGAAAAFSITGTGFFSGQGVFNLGTPLTNVTVQPYAGGNSWPQNPMNFGNVAAQRLIANDAQFNDSATAPALITSNLFVNGSTTITGGIVATGTVVVAGSMDVSSSLTAGSAMVTGSQTVSGDSSVAGLTGAAAEIIYGNNSAQGTSVVTRVISLGQISIGSGTNTLISVGDTVFTNANQTWSWNGSAQAYVNTNNPDTLYFTGTTWHYANFGTGSDEYSSPGPGLFGQWLNLGADYTGMAPLFYPSGSVAAMSGSGFTGNGSGLTTLNASQLTSGTVPVSVLPGGLGLTNLLQQPLTLTGTNVLLNGANFTNFANASFTLTATTNLYFLPPTNLTPGLPFLITVQQGAALTNMLAFNTNGWVPAIFGNILVLPTNSAASKELISVLPYTSSNANFIQTLIP